MQTAQISSRKLLADGAGHTILPSSVVAPRASGQNLTLGARGLGLELELELELESTLTGSSS